MCSYIVQKASLVGSAKGRIGWMKVDTAQVYFDHPYHAPLDHAVGIDFINAAEGGQERVAVDAWLSGEDKNFSAEAAVTAAMADRVVQVAEPAPPAPQARAVLSGFERMRLAAMRHR